MLRMVPMPLATYMNSTRSASAGSFGMCACISASAGIKYLPRPSIRTVPGGSVHLYSPPEPKVMIEPPLTNRNASDSTRPESIGTRFTCSNTTAGCCAAGCPTANRRRATVAMCLRATDPPLTACLAEAGRCRRRRRITIRAMKSLVFWALLLVIGVAVWVLSVRLEQTPAPAPRFPDGELVDLSHSYGADTIFWPTSERFRLSKDAEGITPAGFYYSANSFFTSEHGGTHLDAPVHFAQGKQSVDEIPLQRFFGPAVVVDVTKQSEGNADYQVTVDDLRRSESDGAMTADT